MKLNLNLNFELELETKFKFTPRVPNPPLGSHPNPSSQGPHPTNFETQLNSIRKLETNFNSTHQGPHPTKFKYQTRKQTQKLQFKFQIEPKTHILEQVPNFENKLDLI